MKRMIFAFLFFSFASQAQTRNSNWAISDSILLNFTIDSSFVSSSALHTTDIVNSFVEPMATISDTSGQLLFYTNGFTIWNRNNEVMLNGDSLLCNFSVTNGVVIIPFPNSSSLYYIFYINRLIGQGTDGINYSIVDMNDDGGLGGVTIKNISIIQGMDMEKLSAVKHGNGRDWWLLSHDQGLKFIKFLVTPIGVSDSSSQTIGIIQDLIQGEICFSRSGNKLGLVSGKSVEVYDFNRCNGTLSNLTQLDSTSDLGAPGYYGCSFSPDESKFYTSRFIGASPQSDLYQFDLSNEDAASTKTLIWHSPTNNYVLGQHELALDGKIYIAMGYYLSPDATHYAAPNLNLSVINQPDSLGLVCDFQQWSFYLGGKRTTLGLPNMPNYNLSALDGSVCDTLNLSVKDFKNEKTIVRVFPNPVADELTVEVLNGIAPKQIEITNSLGQNVIRLKQTKPTALINIHSLPSGIYFIKVHLQNGELLAKKFIKQ